jgi:hypothetical protein
MAAPRTPRAGKPSRPKISSELPTTLTRMARKLARIGSRTLPVQRQAVESAKEAAETMKVKAMMAR